MVKREILDELARERDEQLQALLLLGERFQSLNSNIGWQTLKKEIEEQIVGWKDQLCRTDLKEMDTWVIRGQIKAYAGILSRVASVLEDYREAKDHAENK